MMADMKVTIASIAGLSLVLLVVLAGCKVSGEFDPDIGKKDRDEEYYGRATVVPARAE